MLAFPLGLPPPLPPGAPHGAPLLPPLRPAAATRATSWRRMGASHATSNLREERRGLWWPLASYTGRLIHFPSSATSYSSGLFGSTKLCKWVP